MHPYPPSEDASDHNNNIVQALSTNWAGVGYGVCVTRRRRSHAFENATPTASTTTPPRPPSSLHTLLSKQILPRASIMFIHVYVFLVSNWKNGLRGFHRKKTTTTRVCCTYTIYDHIAFIV